LPLAKRLAVEAGVRQGWERYAGHFISLERFGASAPYRTIYEHLGLTVARIIETARTMTAVRQQPQGSVEA
jgi:transketolase